MTFVSNYIVIEQEHSAALPLNSLQETDPLISRCIANERAAQEMLYKKYYGKLMALCMRYLKSEDDAMEALNTGFLKIYRNLDKYRNQ